ncbi:MAG: CHAT domain-containing protein [Cocleimonas sp.]|nr:CHAT domain-containing protein [Cocleimonas sp.]
MDILLLKKGNSFQARITNSPAGQAHCDFDIPDNTDAIAACIGSYTKSRSFELPQGFSLNGSACSSDTLPDTLKKIGSALFDVIFKDSMQECLERSLYLSKNNDLRIRLQFSNDAPELVPLPWEYFYNKEEERFLALSTKTPIIRCPELMHDTHTVSVQLPLQILVIISSPKDLALLDVETEWKNLTSSLQALIDDNLVVIKRLATSSIRSLQHELQRKQYHVIHYIGHSDFDANSNNAFLMFEDKESNSAKLEAESFGKLLRDEKSIRLVILNSCEGSKASDTIFFSGVALSLLKKKIPAVIAMQFEISDSAAIIFSSDFYTALANGLPIEESLTEARKAIDIRLNPIEWGTPTLYMRSSNSNLFTLTLPDKPSPKLIEPEKKSKNKTMLFTVSLGILALIITLSMFALKDFFIAEKEDENPILYAAKDPVAPPVVAAGRSVIAPITAGFDCTKARTLSEKAVCSSSSTANIDKDLNTVYARVVSKLPPPLVKEVDEQEQDWLVSRDHYIEQNCILSSRAKRETCIIAYYQARIVILKRIERRESTKFTKVTVIDPPSNIRLEPNGDVSCKIRTKKQIEVYNISIMDDSHSKWFWTKACGSWAVIHGSQIR